MSAFASTSERDAAVLSAARAGKSISWMRREWKVAYETVDAILKRAGITRRPSKGARVEWSDDRTDKMIGLWMAGISLNNISKAIGCSRRSIEYKAKTIGLPPKVPAKSGPPPKSGERRPARRFRRPKLVAAVTASAVPSLNIPLLDLEPLQCRWITSGEREASYFCGHPARGSSSYCEAHHALAYVPAERQTRRDRTDYHLYRRAA